MNEQHRKFMQAATEALRQAEQKGMKFIGTKLSDDKMSVVLLFEPVTMTDIAADTLEALSAEMRAGRTRLVSYEATLKNVHNETEIRFCVQRG